MKRDSMSSFTPPNALGAQATGKSSIHSGPPPSVLKPEHALRPYREDSDDENGYIMGAWQPFAASKSAGYSPVGSLNSPPAKAASTSGFSRVGGGRAHIDTPYAINAGSTQTFPSYGHEAEPSGSGTGTTMNSSRLRDDYGDDSLSLSSNPAARQHGRNGSLPPGAMPPPFHMRTKSQTAIIENAGPFDGPSSSGMRPESMMRDPAPPSAFHRPLSASMDDDDSDLTQPKKKPWYRIRRQRQSSEGSGGSASVAPPPADEAAALDPPAATAPGRSFVVIRKPQVSPARSQNPSIS